MATMNLVFVSNQYDEETGNIKVTAKEVAFPENVTLNESALEKALQNVISSHRAFLYSQQRANEAKKKEPNNDIIARLDEAITTCDSYTPVWLGDDNVYRSVQLLAYCIDNAMHRTFLNGKPVMFLPADGTDLLTAFSDYKHKRISFGDLKKKVVTFGESFNDIPFLKDRTIHFNDKDVEGLVNMYEGIGQPLKWNKKGIKGRTVTKAMLIQQVGLLALQKTFKFTEEEKKDKKVVEF